MKKILLLLMILIINSAPVYARTKTIIPLISTRESFLIADTNGNILAGQGIDTVRPIASISKLLVSLLASKQPLDEQLLIPSTRTVQSSIPRKQISLSRRELLTLALVKSDNFAAQILCSNIPDCINSMNNKALELGMTHTHFEEPTGLSKENVSTATDLLKLMIMASTDPTITKLSSMPNAEIQSGKNIIRIRNTNPLTSKLDIILSKTGFTNPAGGCLIMVVNSPLGQRFMILLGSRNAKTRIPAMEKLYKDMS